MLEKRQQQKGFLFSLSIVATAGGSVSQAHPILEIGATSLFVNFSRDHMIKTNLDLGHMILCGIGGGQTENISWNHYTGLGTL